MFYSGPAQWLIVLITLIPVAGLLVASFRSKASRPALLAAIILLISRQWLFSGDNILPFVGVVWSISGIVAAGLLLLGLILYVLKKYNLARVAAYAATALFAFSPLWVDATNTHGPADKVVTETGGEEGTTTSTTEAESTTTTAPEDCPGGHMVEFADHEGYRVAAEGLISVKSQEVKDQIASLAGADPSILMSYHSFSPLEKDSPLESARSLVDGPYENGSCYTMEAAQAYDEWLILWKLTIIEPADSMPAGSTNSGVSNGEPTVGGEPTGNTEGVIVIYVDAKGKEIGRHGIMKRCVNPVAFGEPPPNIPDGPTDEPGPPKPPEGGKDDRLVPPRVYTPVTPEPRRPPASTTTTVASTGTSTPATTVAPDVTSNPRCPGGTCPDNPSTTTSTTPEPTPTTSTPPGGDPGEPGSG